MHGGARDGEPRPWRWWLLIAAGVLGFLISVGAFSKDRPRARATPIPVVVSAPGDAQVVFGENEHREQATERTDASRLLKVSVVDARTRLPVRGARVFVLEAASRLALEQDALGQSETDRDGTCRVRFDHPESLKVLAIADGYMPGEEPVSGHAVTVPLATGLEISGRVATSVNTPVPDISIVAVHVALPANAADLKALPRSGASFARTVSGPDGGFCVGGLASGKYRLEISADGWAFDYSERAGATKFAKQSPRSHFCDAGARDVQLVVRPIRAFRLALVHGDTEFPAAGTILTVSVVADDAVEAAQFVSYETVPLEIGRGPSGMRVLSREDAPGMVVAYAPLKPNGAVPQQARVVVGANGYKQSATTATLRLPSEIATSAVADTVRLAPDVACEVGTVLLECSRNLEDIWRPRTRYLTALRPGDGVRRYLRGTEVDSERWRFDGVPSGEVELTLFDGISQSAPVRVQVRAGDVVSSAVEFSSPTGVAFELRDETGAAVHDADAVFVVPPGESRAMADLSSGTRLHVGSRGPLHVVHDLKPGTYGFAISKVGYANCSGSFEVVVDQVTIARAVLRSAP